MVAILMISAKFGTPGLLKIKVLKVKVITSWPFVHSIIKKFYLVTQVKLLMRSCDQGLVTVAFQ